MFRGPFAGRVDNNGNVTSYNANNDHVLYGLTFLHHFFPLWDTAMRHTKGDDIDGDMERMLIEDVQTAVGDMVELIKTYRSKNRLSQVIVSTMFKRRLAETEAVIDRAIIDLKVSSFARSRAAGEAADGRPVIQCLEGLICWKFVLFTRRTSISRL